MRRAVMCSNLPPAEYILTVEMAGFRKYTREKLQVQINQDASLDIALQVEGAQESIVVTAEAPLMEANSSSVGKVVENREITNLPLNTRNPYQLVFLTPGVSGDGRHQLRRYAVFGERRPRAHVGHSSGRCGGVAPDRDRDGRGRGVPLGGGDRGIQGAGREPAGGIRQEPGLI